MVVYFNPSVNLNSKLSFGNEIKTENKTVVQPVSDNQKEIGRGSKLGYWVAAGIASAAIAGGIIYAVRHGRGAKGIKNEPPVHNVKPPLTAFQQRALAIKEKAAELISEANKVKDELLEQINPQLKENGAWDLTKIKGKRLYPKGYNEESCISIEKSGINMAEKIVGTNELGGNRVYKDLKGCCEQIITDYLPGDEILKTPKYREISLNTYLNQLYSIKHYQDDGTSVGYVLKEFLDDSGDKYIRFYNKFGKEESSLKFSAENKLLSYHEGADNYNF